MKTGVRSLATLLAAVLLVVRGAPAAEQQGASKLAGIWRGTLEAGAMKLRLVFDIKVDDAGRLTGTLDSPDQHAFGIPIDTITVQDNAVTIELKQIGGTYSGTLSRDTERIEGRWSQMGQALPLVMRRGEKIVPVHRPQVPVPPFPHEATQVAY